MKVPAIVAVYYEYLIENDEVGLEYVPIPLRKQVRRLLRANPVYRAKHPEIMPKTEEAPAAANPAPEAPKEDGGKKNEKAASEETE
nr:MAG TPA: hypothetical protein [Bacteriophage sp.]